MANLDDLEKRIMVLEDEIKKLKNDLKGVESRSQAPFGGGV